MRIRINGEVREFPEPISVSALLTLLKIRRDGIAVEVNREIIPKSRHDSLMLNEDDSIEIVTFVGGG